MSNAVTPTWQDILMERHPDLFRQEIDGQYMQAGYACGRRSETSPNACVISVRFGSDNRSEIRSESFGIHVDRFDPQPEFIGYCIVLAGYDHR